MPQVKSKRVKDALTTTGTSTTRVATRKEGSAMDRDFVADEGVAIIASSNGSHMTN